MKERDKFSKLGNALIAQDPPSTTRLSAYQKILFNKVRRRLQIEKGLVGAAYVAVFAVAFAFFLQADRVQDAARATWWMVCSVHLLLWFLVFFLWRLERLIWRIPSPANRAGRARRKTRTMFICALAACAVGTVFLCAAGLLYDPLKVVQLLRYVLWAPVFFLFWYPFGIGTAVARLWLQFREMEIQSASAEEAEGNPPTNPSSTKQIPGKPSL